MFRRAEVIASYRQFDLLELFLSAYPGVALDAVESRLKRNVLPHFLDEVRYQPAEAKNSLNSDTPFVWSLDALANARARRWFFANFPDGYTRTGAFASAWEIAIREGVNNLTLLISNPTAATTMIVGNARTGEGQLPGHENTGWPKVNETIDFWQDVARQETKVALDEMLRRRP